VLAALITRFSDARLRSRISGVALSVDRRLLGSGSEDPISAGMGDALRHTGSRRAVRRPQG
jgi:hypothetical protein